MMTSIAGAASNHD